MYIMVRHLGMVHISGRIHSPYLSGCGMGSVLLNKGGAGAGSSYSSVDDYIATTHENPFSGRGIGQNLASMNKKIEGLLVKKKEKNINFNI